MKIVLLGSFPICISLYENLVKNKHLTAVGFEESAIQNSASDYENSIKKQGLQTFIINSENLSVQFKNWLQKLSPDLVLVCGFSLKIPKELLNIPTYGFLNIHFGKLPENRGPDPVFWSIKKGETQTYITIHQMDEDWDTGKILLEHPVPIILGETQGMLNSKMSYLLKDLGEKIITLVKDSNNLTLQSSENISYRKRPALLETTIQWEEQTADQIENLVNACNPKYGGASTYYQGGLIRIIEVSPVDTQTPLFGRTPGEIIHAHPQEGLFVCCKYGQMIRINILSSDAGILTGTKYVNLGIRQGQHFSTTQNIKEKQSIIK
ncbi:methionyl-tRNA formyltransferase [Aquimarina sp. 2201CG5-10]|uniref:methionyl-tRNA formyltransferase n=1 Tax=Aquimarina callyspongiae TaxID=3098150 RepID=UPI002AB49400|nr:formyltransferase family protein [Aquimarina sp. 2201CG5-10]MDY8136797.1 formyltransferase family protein [Aquimarina sp. 2201CG5-10]